MPINLSNPVFTIVDVDQQRATSIQSSQVQQGSRTVPRTFVSEATVDDRAWQRGRNVVTDTQGNQQLHETVSPPTLPEQPPHHETSTNALRTEPSPNIAISQRTIPLHGSRTRNSARAKQTEEQMLKEVLVRGGHCFSRLSEPLQSGDNTLRVVHLTYSRRTFAMLTAMVRRQQNLMPKPFGCIFWQTSVSPPKAVSITMYIEQDTALSSPRFSAACSCKPALLQSECDHQSCSHLRTVLQPSNVSDSFRCTLLNHNTFQTSRNVFGRVINGDDNNYEFSTVQLMARSAQSNNQLNIQNKKARFLTMFDHSRLRFVPLVLQKKKKVQCLMCRGHRSRRGPCEHEINCEQYYFRQCNEEQEFDGNMSDFSSDDSDDSDNQERNRNRDYNVPPPDVEVMQYCRTDVKIPLLPCKSIQLSSFLTAYAIEQEKGREIQVFEDWFGICKSCKFQRSLQSLSSALTTFRVTRMFTLSQQVVTIKVEDWKCPRCSRQVRFTGVGRSIFPVRKSYCFTYELMYYFVHNVCRLGISFRAQYSSYHLSQISDSARARFDNFESTAMTPIEDFHSGRRRCAEAFNYFIKCLDTSDPKLCSNLFSCKDCERSLTPKEKVLLGYGMNEEVSEKRFDAIVIDGTTAGILSALPNYERDTRILGTNTSIYRNQRFITSKMFQNAIKSLSKLVRSRIRTVVTRRRVLSTSSSTLTFRIPTHSGGKSKSKLSVCKEHLACLRKYLMDDSCFCAGTRSRSTSAHTAMCRKVRREYDNSVAGDDIRHFIRSVLKMEQRASTTNQVIHDSNLTEEEPVGSNNEEDDNDNSDAREDSSNSNSDQEESRNSDEEDGGDSADESDENSDESTVSDENESDSNSENSGSDDNSTHDPFPDGESVIESEEPQDDDNETPQQGQQEEQQHQHQQEQQQEQQQQQQQEDVFFITIDVKNPARCGQVIESFLDVMELMLIDSTSLPYIRPCGQHSLDDGRTEIDQADIGVRNMTLFNNTGSLKISEEVIGYDSFRLHEQLSTKLEQFADCECNENAGDPPRRLPCSQCTHCLASASEKCSEVNPIFSRFSEQLVLHSTTLKEKVSILSSNFASAVREHAEFAEKYFEHLISNLEPACKDYWSAYAGCKLQPLRQLTDQTNDQGPRTGTTGPTAPSNDTTTSSETNNITPTSSATNNDTTNSSAAINDTTTSSATNNDTTTSSAAINDITTSSATNNDTTTSSAAINDTITSSATVNDTTTSSAAINDTSTSPLATNPSPISPSNNSTRLEPNSSNGRTTIEDEDVNTDDTIQTTTHENNRSTTQGEENNATNSNAGDDAENRQPNENAHGRPTTNQSSRVPDRSPFTGISFLGRENYRPLFTFDLREGHQCGKRYPQNSNHSPGLLTVMCACSNPKLIGYIVMERCESTALALSIALMFFKIPPCTIFYDNGCNALSSALLRLPWLLLFSFIVVDRFHYKGHSCNCFYDADRYSVLDKFKSSSAESMNAKIKRSLHNMRFLRGENLVYYLNARFALLNLEAKYYEMNATRDAEDANMNKFFSSLIDCSCATCACEDAMDTLLIDPNENDPEPELD